MITGSMILNVLVLLAVVYAGGFLLLSVIQWISYRRDCKKYGKKCADEIWKGR